MPVYEFKCDSCGRFDQEARPIEDRDYPYQCRDCGEVSRRLFTVGYHKNFTPYHNRQLDVSFGTKSDEKKYTKEHGMVDITGELNEVKHGRGRWKNA